MARSPSTRSSAGDRPNILLLLTDMQRFDTIAALGNPIIKTPNLDRLVQGGTAFTHCYTPSPVCVAARCSLHYGRYPQRTRCTHNMEMPAFPGDSYPERLAAAGYRTHAVGKCHFHPQEDLHGFHSREIQEEIVGDLHIDDYLRDLHAAGFDYICDPHGVRGEMYYIPQVASMPASLHPSQWIGDRSVSFIADHEGSDTPWMLKSSFIHPHPPFNPPDPWHKLYRAPNMPLPRIPHDRDAHLTYGNHVQNRYKYRDRGCDLNLIRQIRASYYACISFIDYQVGRILDALQQSGQLDDTLIVFTSDHGEYQGDYHCFGKRSMHDVSSRVPLIAHGPGFRTGRICTRPASLVDFAPTICAMAEADTSDMDGVRMDHLASNRVKRPSVYSQHEQGGMAEYLVAREDACLFYSAADDREFCYHKSTDPHQQHLVPTQGPHQQELVAGLRADLQAFLRHMHAHEALDGTEALGWRRYPPLHISSNPDDGLIIQDHPWADQHIPGYSP